MNIHLKKTILLVNVVLTILIAWVLGSIVFTWASHVGAKSNMDPNDLTIKQSTPAPAPIKKDLKEFQIIVKNDIFNTATDTSGAATVNTAGSNAKETTLNLKLRGTAVGENSASFAIIFDGNTGKEDLYELNDTIQNARIQHILPDKVILNINGREEALLLPVESEAPAKRAYRPPVKTRKPAKKTTARRTIPRPPVNVQQPPKTTNVPPTKLITPPKVSEPKETIKPPSRPESHLF